MTAIDTNVVIAPWDKRQSQYSAARAALEEALDLGPLIVSAPVYAELLAWPSQTEALVRSFSPEPEFRSSGQFRKKFGAWLERPIVRTRFGAAQAEAARRGESWPTLRLAPMRCCAGRRLLQAEFSRPARQGLSMNSIGRDLRVHLQARGGLACE